MTPQEQGLAFQERKSEVPAQSSRYLHSQREIRSPTRAPLRVAPLALERPALVECGVLVAISSHDFAIRELQTTPLGHLNLLCGSTPTSVGVTCAARSEASLVSAHRTPPGENLHFQTRVAGDIPVAQPPHSHTTLGTCSA